MTASAEPGSGYDLSTGRPTTRLPARDLLRVSLYWLGLSSIFAGLGTVLASRLVFDGLVANQDEAGRTLALLFIPGALIAIIVQPTIGSISDYTASRWGRRKPYIFIGTILDVIFLAGIAFSQEIIAIAAFIALLQFSSNFAQGPYQGYVPDLVPAPQVGLASALVGMMQVFGNVTGFIVAGLALMTSRYDLALIALGLIELLTMLSVVIHVRDSRPPRRRAGRSWRSVAAEAWGTDILRERSFLWLIASRLAVLMAGGILVNLALFYLARSLGYSEDTSGVAVIFVVAMIALATVVAVIPAARLSDRVGRKAVIYGSCVIGAIGLALVALAPALFTGPELVPAAPSEDVPALVGRLLDDARFVIALVGVILYGLSAGTFLAVDWALLTDIIPKASSGRYMGLSNVATASAGVLSLSLGGTLMDFVGGSNGPQAALWMGVALFGVAIVLLRPVDERRRELKLLPDGAGST
ncbi:MAG: MFS transporter [Chloroflexota bacterium]